LALGKNMSREERRRQSLMASVYTFLIMMTAYYAGTLVMNTFGISIPGLRIAGGLIVAFIGFRMLFPEQKTEAAEEEDQMNAINHHRKTPNIAFVPLAMPSTAGPGTIAMIISSVSTVKESVYFSPWVVAVAPVLIFLSVSAILWGSLLSSGTIMRMIGESGIE